VSLFRLFANEPTGTPTLQSPPATASLAGRPSFIRNLSVPLQGWLVLGSLILIGPFVYMAKLCTAMNLLAENYNING